MPNTFISLNVPNTDVAGVPAITSLTGSPKTFVFAADAVPNGRYVVEGSNDGGATWDILVGLDGSQVLFASNNTAGKSVDAIVERIRVRSIGNGAVAVPPSITIAAPPALGPSIFGVLNVPIAEGLGAVTDLGSSAGPLKTFIVRGDIRPGSRFTILASVDGLHFEPTTVFTSDQEGAEAISILCRFLRVQRHGIGPTPSIAFGSEGTFDPATATATSSLAIDEDEEHETSGVADEEILVEYSVPLAALAAPNLSVSFAGINVGQGEFGNAATYRVLLGGAIGVPAGLEIARVTSAVVAGETSVVTSGPSFDRPAQAAIPIKVTGRGDGSARAVLRGFVLLFHSASDQSNNQGGDVMSKDVAQRDLDMAGFHILNVGNPQGPSDATHVDSQSVPLASSGAGSPGQSFLAAPADHVHPASGGGGGTSTTETLDAEGLQSTSGTGEEVFKEWFVDFDALPGTQIVPVVSAYGKGSGSMNVRVGGTPGGVDGALVATVLLADAGTFHAVDSLGQPFNKPIGIQPVALTAIAPAAGIPVTARGKVVTLTAA